MPEEASLNLVFRFTDNTRSVVRFDLPPRIEATAETLGRLLEELASVRAKMAPPVTVDRMKALPTVAVTGAPWVIFAKHKPGTVSFVIAHPGYGWQRFDLSTDDAQRLHAHLQSAIDEASPAGNMQ